MFPIKYPVCDFAILPGYKWTLVLIYYVPSGLLMNFEWHNSMLQVVLGDMGTGKTSLVLRFIKGQFFDHQVFFFYLLNLSWNWLMYELFDFIQYAMDNILMHSSNHRNRQLELHFSPKFCLWQKQQWSLIYGTQQAKNGTTAWLPCTIGGQQQR